MSLALERIVRKPSSKVYRRENGEEIYTDGECSRRWNFYTDQKNERKDELSDTRERRHGRRGSLFGIADPTPLLPWCARDAILTVHTYETRPTSEILRSSSMMGVPGYPSTLFLFVLRNTEWKREISTERIYIYIPTAVFKRRFLRLNFFFHGG